MREVRVVYHHVHAPEAYGSVSCRHVVDHLADGFPVRHVARERAHVCLRVGTPCNVNGLLNALAVGRQVVHRHARALPSEPHRSRAPNAGPSARYEHNLPLETERPPTAAAARATSTVATTAGWLVTGSERITRGG